MMRSPAINAASIFGHALSKAVSNALVRQFPDKPRRGGRLVSEVQEVLILADDDCVIRDGVDPDFGNGGIPQIQVEDVSAFYSARAEETGECRG